MYTYNTENVLIHATIRQTIDVAKYLTLTVTDQRRRKTQAFETFGFLVTL